MSATNEQKEQQEEKTTMEKKMILTCKACQKEFNSTFSVDDFATLSRDQLKEGTLHLCPFCGDLAIYSLNDYHESESR